MVARDPGADKAASARGSEQPQGSPGLRGQARAGRRSEAFGGRDARLQHGQQAAGQGLSPGLARIPAQDDHGPRAAVEQRGGGRLCRFTVAGGQSDERAVERRRFELRAAGVRRVAVSGTILGADRCCIAAA